MSRISYRHPAFQLVVPGLDPGGRVTEFSDKLEKRDGSDHAFAGEIVRDFVKSGTWLDVIEKFLSAFHGGGTKMEPGCHETDGQDGDDGQHNIFFVRHRENSMRNVFPVKILQESRGRNAKVY